MKNIRLLIYTIPFLFVFSCRQVLRPEPTVPRNDPEKSTPGNIDPNSPVHSFPWMETNDSTSLLLSEFFRIRPLMEKKEDAIAWIDVANRMATSSFINGQKQQALSILLDATETALDFQIEDPVTQANIASIFADAYDFDKTRLILEKTIPLFEKHGDYRSAGIFYSNLLTCAMGTDSVGLVGSIADRLASPIYDSFSFSRFNVCRARMFLAMEARNYPQALSQARKALQIARTPLTPCPDTTALLARMMQDMGTIHLQCGHPDSALAYYEKAYALNQEKNELGIMQDILSRQIEVYRLLGKDESRLAMQYMALSDSLVRDLRHTQQQNLDHFIRQRGQEREMSRLYYDALYKDKIITKQNIIYLSLIGILCLFLSLVLVLYRNKQHKAKTNRILYEKTRELLRLEQQSRLSASMLGNTAGPDPQPERGCSKPVAESLTQSPPGQIKTATTGQAESGKTAAGNAIRPVSNGNGFKIEEKQRLFLLCEIRRMLDEEKAYTDKDFCLDTLSRMLNSNTNYVSHIINDHFKKNFSTLTSEYRVRYSCLLLEDPANDTYTLEYIARIAGFGNRVSFTQQFKKQVGMAPSEYWKMAKKQRKIASNNG